MYLSKTLYIFCKKISCACKVYFSQFYLCRLSPPRASHDKKFTSLVAARWPAVRDAGGSAVLSQVLRRLLRGVLRQLRRADRRRPGPNVARGSALARDRGLLLLRHLPRVPPRSAVPAATWCHLLQHSVQQGGTADDTERLLRRAAAAPAVLPQVIYSRVISHTTSLSARGHGGCFSLFYLPDDGAAAKIMAG